MIKFVCVRLWKCREINHVLSVHVFHQKFVLEVHVTMMPDNRVARTCGNQGNAYRGVEVDRDFAWVKTIKW